MVVTKSIKLKSKGDTDIIDITDRVVSVLGDCELKNGIVTIFVSGSTGAITTIEYEPGLVQDLKQAFEIFAPRQGQYQHNIKWQDGNGVSHDRAAFLGPCLTVPFSEKKMLLGIWQQIVFIDFDNRSRSRELILQIIGE